MNVRTIALAITLIVPAAAVFAAEDTPYTGPDKPVMTTAANDVVTQEVYGWRIVAGKDKTPAMKSAPTDHEVYGWRNTAGKGPTLQARGGNAGFKVGSGYTSSAENVAIKDAPTDTTLQAAGKDKTTEAMENARIYVPTAN
jgi:hypothetical protein